MQSLSARKPLAEASGEPLQETLIVINGFIHDLSTGVWFGALVVMSRISTKIGQVSNQLLSTFTKSLMGDLSTLALISLIIMLITGVFRALTLKTYGWSGDIAPGRKRLLLIKHTILGFLVVCGVLFQVSLFF